MISALRSEVPYRQRKRLGLVQPKPRRLNRELAKVIRTRYFNREATQLQLALEYGVGQNTISRVVSLQVYDPRSLKTTQGIFE